MGAAGAAAGGSALLGLVGAGVQVYANNQALKGQSRATRETLRQLTESEGERMRQIDEQAATARGYLAEDADAAEKEIQRGLEAENVDIAKRTAEIRRELLNVLGEQSATLAARGIGGGSAAVNMEREAQGYADDDIATLDINRATAAADAATAKSGVRTGVARERHAIDTEVSNARRVSEMTINNAYRSGAIEMRNASDQTGLANLAAVLNGMSGAAQAGANYYYQSQANRDFTQPSKVNAARIQYRPLIRSNNGMAAGV